MADFSTLDAPDVVPAEPTGTIDQKLQVLQQQELGGVIKKDAGGYVPKNKMERIVRRQVYTRYYLLRNNPARSDAEEDWETGDKEYQMWVDPNIDPDDWRSHLQLPDAFTAIQTQAQETIERKSRPTLVATEESDEPIQDFANSVMNYNMNNTGFDYQYFLAKLSAAIRGTAFLRDYWRTDKRIVKEPQSVNPDGTIKYADKEITDFDDDYTEWIPNEFVYVDEKAKHIDDAIDWVRREILNIREFHRIYGNKAGFINTEFVVQGGDTSTRSFFQLPKDITNQDVEILHYENQAIDAYWAVANNVPIYVGPLPTKHKQLSLGVQYQYRIPGKFYGMGIPKVIHMLSEERKSIRNLNMDRQKLQINKMFLHNNAFDIDDDDLVSRPGGVISVDTNGQPINNAITPLEYGDVPASYFKTEEILLEDIRRGTGIDDRVSGANVGSTATQAALQKESALKRINLISLTSEMDTLVRIGRLKWSNIQFFYGTPRMEKITEDNEERDQKVYRTITVQNKKFSIVDDNGQKSLRMDEAQGATGLRLDAKFNKYLEGNFDITVQSDVFQPISKAIQQTKITENFSLLVANPATMALLDLPGATSDLLKVNDIDATKWLKPAAKPAKDMMVLAEAENMILAAGQPLGPTEGATEDHTMVHLWFTKTAEFQGLSPEIQSLFQLHILGEHDANPATGSAADALSVGQAAVPAAGAPVSDGSGQTAPLALSAQTGQPQPQVADLQATNFQTPER